MQSTLVRFIQVLRTHDLRVSPAETLDAMGVMAALGYPERERLRDGLAAALAKSPEEEATFLQCFDRFFRQELADFSFEEVEPGPDRDAGEAETPKREAGCDSTEEESSTLELAAGENPVLRELLKSPLMQGLLRNDRNELTVAMSRAGERTGLQQIRIFTQKGQFTRRILDELGEQHIRRAIIELEREQNPALEELQRYRDILRDQVRDYVEREYLLNAEGRQREFLEDVLSRTRLNNIEHLYLRRVHELVHKMARRLAGRHTRRRHPIRRGQLDMARTLRRGIASDGVLFDIHWRRPRKEKPQLLAICDVSGSVAAYAKFLLLFLYSLQDVLPRVRSFAFSSHLGEVSHYFDDYPVEKAIELVNWKYAGATDYGASLEDFSRLALDDINSNTTVIVMGDARNNHGDPRLDILRDIYHRSKQVIWLNPESRRSWGTGDSEMRRYQSACHFSAECNNLRQLERIVDQLLKSTH